MKRIVWVLVIWVLVIVAVAVGGSAWYIHRAKARALNSGSIHLRDQTGGGTGRRTAGTQISGTESAVPGQTARPGEAGADEAAQAAAPVEAGSPAPPASDSIRRNPPNGAVFAGTGKYQLYRQGDITWRLDTQTGVACILFATEAQWRKTQVYDHGCGAA